MSFARNDEDMSEMIDTLGTESYGIWWIIVEMVAEQMDKSDKHSARFSFKKWAKSCGVSVKKFQKTVSFLSKLEKISVETSEKFPDFLKISIPKLLNFRDEWSKRSGVTTEKVMSDSGVTTEQETEVETEVETEKNYSEDSNEFRLSLFLLNNIRKRKSDYKIPDLQGWSKHSDYILRIDRRDINEVKKVILWCQSDEFWQNNILSTAKLRKQYDKLVLQMRKDKPNNRDGNGMSQDEINVKKAMEYISS